MENWKENTTGSLRDLPDSDNYIEVRKKYGYALREGDEVVSRFHFINDSQSCRNTTITGTNINHNINHVRAFKEATQILWESDYDSLEARLVDKRKIDLLTYPVVSGESPMDLYLCKDIYDPNPKDNNNPHLEPGSFSGFVSAFNPPDTKFVRASEPSSSILGKLYQPVENNETYYVLEKECGKK